MYIFVLMLFFSKCIFKFLYVVRNVKNNLNFFLILKICFDLIFFFIILFKVNLLIIDDIIL